MTFRTSAALRRPCRTRRRAPRRPSLIESCLSLLDMRRGTVHGISGRPPQGPTAALVVAASRRRPGTSPKACSVVLGSGPASSGHAAEQRPPSNNELAGLLGGRFNNSSTIPVHGAGPWVIVETPTRHHPRRRGRPIPRRRLLGWSERVRIRQRLRAHICAGSGRTPGATPKSNVDTTRGLDAGFSETRVFFVRLRYLEGGARQVRGGAPPHPRRGPAHRRQHRHAAGAAAPKGR